ncbi:MAG: hypothetical protein AAGG38_07670 [Planctomycetota bacterium]
MLAQVLQENLGARYNIKAVGNFSFADLTMGFIHGMIPGLDQAMADMPGGTCASMPVLYVAVGRRLGYPLKLVLTDSHVFARWDGLNHDNPAWRERFNCETTNGFHKFDDDYYRTWPFPVTEHEVRVNGFLKSLTPAGELALFMATRGHHAEDVHQLAFAARCYENAYRYDPSRPCYRSWFLDAALASGYQASTPALQASLKVKRGRSYRQPVASANPHNRIANNPLAPTTIPRPQINPTFRDTLFPPGYSPDPKMYYDSVDAFDF